MARTIRIPLQPNKEATHLEIKLYYNLGGQNYFTGTNEQRGLYLLVSPVTVGENFVQTTAFAGIKQLVLPMARASQKKLDTYKVDNETKERLITHVLNKNGLQLAEGTEIANIEILCKHSGLFSQQWQ